MPIAKIRTPIFVIAAVVVLEVFQCGVGSVALFVFGGRTSGVEKLMLFIPFFSLPILILAIRKLGAATSLMLVLFGISHAGYTKISWPKWEAVYVMLKLDWPLLAICILLTIVYRYRNSATRLSNV